MARVDPAMVAVAMAMAGMGKAKVVVARGWQAAPRARAETVAHTYDERRLQCTLECWHRTRTADRRPSTPPASCAARMHVRSCSRFRDNSYRTAVDPCDGR